MISSNASSAEKNMITNTNALSINSAANINGRNTLVDFSVGSMPANYGYDESFTKEDEEEELNEETSLTKPRILIMGLRK